VDIYFYARLGKATSSRGFSYAQPVKLHSLDRALHALRQPLHEPPDIIGAFCVGTIVMRSDLIDLVDGYLGARHAIPTQKIDQL
jgi:hypothetical protein